MKIQICSAFNERYGKRYYIRYKKFLFWHSVYWPVDENGKCPVTYWYEPLDLKRYFVSKEEAYRYAEKNLFPSKYKVEKEIDFTT